MNTMKPAGLSGDPYTIYMNAERMLQMNPEGPMTETYRMQRDMALMQMRSPNYRGRRPQWLDREIASYPEMPGVIDGNRGTMPPIKSQPQPQIPGQPSFDPNIMRPFQDQAGIPWMESIGRTSPPISAYKNPSELAQKNENELRRGRTLTEQQIDLIKKDLLERNRSL